MSKVFLRSLLFAGLCAFTLGLAQPAKAIVILSNLSGTNIGTGSSLGVGALDGRDRRKAVGLTVGANDLSFTSLTGRFINRGSEAGPVGGGIFSNVNGNPGTQLVAFNAVSIAAGANDVQLTLTAVSPFILMANTSYWFLLEGPDVGSSVLWGDILSNPEPTPSTEVSFNGYRFSDTAGASWMGSSIRNAVQIEASLVTAVPEPGTLALFGLGLLGLGIAHRRVRAQV